MFYIRNNNSFATQSTFMTEAEQQLKDLSEIRSMMERSSRFISLSGLSGIAAGVSALLGAAMACWYFGGIPTDETVLNRLFEGPTGIDWHSFIFLSVDAAMIVLVAVTTAFFFTNRKAQKENTKIWDSTSKRLLINLLIPLVTGGILCLILLYHRYVFILAPLTLVFYGLALVNASRDTLNDIRYLGISEIILGLIATHYVGNGMIFWMIGFGILHILYGGIMYFRYER